MSNFTAAAVGNENTHPHATADGERTLCGMRVAETGADFDLLQIAGRCPYCHREAAAKTEAETLARVTGSTEATVIHERVDYSSGSRGEVVETSRSHFRTTDNPMDTVIAEDAPIGVLLWPVVDPKFAPNFTLMEVQTVRRANRSYVRWIYENGKERSFDMGERVAVQLPQPEAPVEHVTKTLAYCAHCGSAIGREDGRWVDVVSGDQGGTYDHCPDNDGGHTPIR